MRARKKPRIGDCVVRPDGSTARFVRERDDENKTADHYRVMDTLALLLKNNAINQDMHDAGRIFEADFHRAFASGYGSGWPSEISGLSSSGQGESIVVTNATSAQAVWNAIEAVGGHESPNAAALWYVVGLGASLREWSTRAGWRGRSMTTDEAKGVLVSALWGLTRVYGLVPRTGRIRAMRNESSENRPG